MSSKPLNKKEKYISSTEDKLKYAINNGDAKIEKIKFGNSKALQNVLTIGDKSYRYNPKNITKVLTTKLNKLTKNDKYKATNEIKRIYNSIRLSNFIKSYAIKQQVIITDFKSAFDNYVNAYSITNIKLKKLNGLSYIKYQYEKLKPFLIKSPNMKILISVFVIVQKGYYETDPDTDVKIYIQPLIKEVRSLRYVIYNITDLKETLNKAPVDLQEKIIGANFWMSGLKIEGIDKIVINYDRYNPTRGGSYIELPKHIALKKACINIKNEDNRCFQYSVQCGFYKTYELDHPQDIRHYKKLVDDKINWEGMKYPCCNNDIDKFEEKNNGLISINIYHEFEYNEEKGISVHRRTKVINAKHHISLLKIENESGKTHYVYIKDYNKLIGSQTNKHKNKLFHCRYCQHGFKRQDLLDTHVNRGCLSVEGQSVELPAKGSFTKFQNEHRRIKCPYVVYGDFECLTEKIENNLQQNTDISYTTKYQNHTPTGFQLTVVDSKKNIVDNLLYRGKDCMDVFCKKICEIEKDIMNKISINTIMLITDEEQQEFNNSTQCYLCNKEITLNDKKGCKVKGYCNLTDRYIGCAHNECNIKFNYKDLKIPIFFHNLKNYDAHLIISNAHNLKSGKKTKINVIAQNSEKFITFGFDHIIFKDSFGFLTSSLEKLIKINKYIEDENDKNKFNLIDNWQNNFVLSSTNSYVNTIDDLNILTEKGVYPYDYMDSWERFEETQLPPKESFYSKLTDTHISDDDYERANRVWSKFKIKNMGEYHDLYLQTDVLQLADIFENFRTMCIEYYGLDPAHYYTLPNYAWDAMLKKTGIELELITDLDMYEFIESGLRGGMCQVSHKNVKANNKYLDDYDENITSSYNGYLDANNLYGKSMTQSLPYKSFEWCNDIKNTEHVLAYKDENDYKDDNYENENNDELIGYILEVDLEYPKELHDLHSDYPLAPENMSVSANMVSDFSNNIYKHYHNDKGVVDEKSKKLILNLQDKTKYVIHICNLKYYLQQGMILTNVHRCLKFQQSKWLKPWIDFNTKKRTEVKTDFEKDLFKLLNLAVFGKTMEDVRSHVDFELVDDIKRLEKCLNNPTMKHRHFINEHLVGIEKIKPVVKLNKPIYVGMTILDKSKLHMYKFYYDVLKAKYNDKIKLAYTDTDSLVIHVETEDLYKDLKQMNEHMDFSDYPKNHENYDISNKKKIGNFKDELNGKILREYIGLKPKMYAMDVQNDKVQKKAKGVPKHIVKNKLDFNLYKRTLEENHLERVNFNSIRSYEHNIYSINCNKVGLSNFENKRYYVNNNLSYPYGHYAIPKKV